MQCRVRWTLHPLTLFLCDPPEQKKRGGDIRNDLEVLVIIRESQMKTLNIFISLFIEHKRYTVTSFLYVVSIALHTSVPALWKCMDTSRKKFFWLREQPLVHRLLHLFVGPERLASHRLFEWSKDMKVTEGGEGARSGEYGGCGRHSKDRSWIVATVERAVWGRALFYI